MLSRPGGDQVLGERHQPDSGFDVDPLGDGTEYRHRRQWGRDPGVLGSGTPGGAGQSAARTRLAGLAASESIDDSVVVRVPSPGTYEYFACVRESTAPPSTDNCAKEIVVTVEQQTPDDPSIDPRFDDAFWQEFVFGQYSSPNTIDHQVIQVLNTTSPNVYIYMGTGHQVIPGEHRDIIREAIPSAGRATHRATLQRPH